tara:strand:+ start:836 stop:964 length:129 start_codon:yes stop_codon:yes gene_type:complete
MAVPLKTEGENSVLVKENYVISHSTTPVDVAATQFKPWAEGF